MHWLDDDLDGQLMADYLQDEMDAEVEAALELLRGRVWLLPNTPKDQCMDACISVLIDAGIDLELAEFCSIEFMSDQP